MGNDSSQPLIEPSLIYQLGEEDINESDISIGNESVSAMGKHSKVRMVPSTEQKYDGLMPHERTKKIGVRNWPAERFVEIKKKKRTKLTKIHKLLKDDTFDPLMHLRNPKNGIPCRKYHYQINSFSYYDACFSISRDGKNFVISSQCMGHDHEEDAHHQHEPHDDTVEADTRKEFPIEEVQGFVFGAFSSRFWVLRRGINEILANERAVTNKKELQQALPFYAWECVTIQLVDRNIDLVFRNDVHMQLFLKVLILALDSFDSQANSIRSLREIKVIKRSTSCAAMMHSIYKGYVLMRVRMKLSYEATV